ncbi:MAG: UDP-N-acetylglucosamine 2-epimerase (hydrolyzing) [bacterium]|nr:UDP-N-acetylglucosamine 2-epimerase (hydrolyzing) [bacterium]
MELCIILTTRGNYAKFKKIIKLAQENPQINLSTVVGGELLLRDRSTSFFDFPITRSVYFNVQGDSLGVMGKSTGMAINEFTNAFEELKPDLVMVVGDRFETFAAVTAAFMCNIKVAHLEGGEVSGCLDNQLRYAISELASIHFPCTEKAGENLAKFEKVYVVGSTSIDVLTENSIDFKSLQDKTGIGSVVDITKPYLLVIYHPDTLHYDEVASELTGLITAVDNLKLPTIWLNSNMDAGSGTVGHLLRQYKENKNPYFIRFLKSLPIDLYSPLLASCSCVIGNSSSGVREAGYFGTPNVTIGKRQENRELCKNTLVAHDNYTEHIGYQLEHGRYEPDYTYGDGTASEKIMGMLCTLG